MFHMNSTPHIFDSHICISNPVILTDFIYVNLDYTAYYKGQDMWPKATKVLTQLIKN